MKSVIEEGFIGVDMPPLPDEIWRGVRLLQLTEEAAVTTASDTFTAWLSPVTETVTYSGTASLYGIICGNNPVNFRDPSGLCTEGQPATAINTLPQYTSVNNSLPNLISAVVPGINAPPVPVPGGGPGAGWRWNPNPGNSRGGTWGPQQPLPGQSQPSSSWDPEGHWDVDDGRGNRQRYDENGRPVTPEEAHGGQSSSSGMSADAMNRMSQITGLTGGALITYIIISEGTRLIPVRNLVPVP